MQIILIHIKGQSFIEYGLLLPEYAANMVARNKH